MSKVPKVTKRLDLLAEARFAQVMERRRREGRDVVTGCTCLAVMFALVNRADGDDECFPSMETIAIESQAGLRTAKRTIAILEDEGLIRIQTRTWTKGQSKGEAKNGSTNVYTIDWDALSDCGDGGSRSRANLAPDHNEGTESGQQLVTGQSGTRSGANLAHDRSDHVPACPRSGAKSAPITGQSCAHLKEGTSQEPPNEPPKEGGAGGESESSQAKETGVLREQARQIVDAYPPTSSDARLSDEQAAVDAIRNEQTTSEAVHWHEIRDAALAVRARCDVNPRWCRNWLRERGYLNLVQDARRKANRPPRREPESFYLRAKLEREAIARSDARTDGLLRGLTHEELLELREEALAMESETARRMLATADPRSSPALRGFIAALVERRTMARGAA